MFGAAEGMVHFHWKPVEKEGEEYGDAAEAGEVDGAFDVFFDQLSPDVPV